jgi:hypothetical protein
MLVPLIVIVLRASFHKPPPSWEAVLPVIVLLLIETVLTQTALPTLFVAIWHPMTPSLV